MSILSRLVQFVQTYGAPLYTSSPEIGSVRAKRRRRGNKSWSQQRYMEAMEQRVLMTTVLGGQAFTYLDPRGVTVQVSVTGNSIAELFSTVQAEDGSMLVGDLVGNGSASNVQGTQGVGRIFVPGLTAVQTNLRTIASNNSGATFTFNLTDLDATGTVITNGTLGPVFTLQLIQINPNNDAVLATVNLSNQVGLNFVGRDTYANASVTASAFNPFDQRLYFVLKYDFTSRTGTSTATTTLNELFAVDVNTDIVTDVGAMQGGTTYTYTAMSFVTDSANTETLWFYRQLGANAGNVAFPGNATGPALAGISIGGSGAVPVSAPNNVVGPFDAGVFSVIENYGPTTNQFLVTSLVGLAAVPGNLDGTGQQYLFGIEPGAGTGNTDAHLVRINLNPTIVSSGTVSSAAVIAINWGPANDPTLSGMAWNPTVSNPFTDSTGSLVSLDTALPEMRITNSRLRIANGDVYAVYLTASDASTTVTFEGFTTTTTGLQTLLYTGSPGTINGATLPGATGQVFLGARGFVPNPNTAGGWDSNVIFNTATVLGAMGGFPQLNTPELLGEASGNLQPGLYVGRTLEESLTGAANVPAQAPIGNQFTHVTTMAVSLDGQVVVYDSVSRRVGIVNPTTGVASSSVVVGAGAVEAIAYGDPNLTGTQALYAIVDQGNGTGPALGTLDPITGVFTLIGSLNMGFHARVTSMVFTPGGTVADPSHQTLYVFADPDTYDSDSTETLYQVNPFTGATVNAPTYNGAGYLTSANGIGQIVNDDNTPMEITSATFNTAGQMLIYDRLSGRLLDLNTTTLDIGVNVSSNAAGISSNVFAVALDPNTLQTLAVDNSGGRARLAVIKGTSETIQDGQSIGRFLFDGVWAGNAFLSGSIETFYSGLFLGPTFSAVGDIRNLLSLTSIGTTAVSTPISAAGDITTPAFTSNLNITAGGKVGYIFANGVFQGTVHASNQDDVLNLVDGTTLGGNVAPQREIQAYTSTGLADPVTGLAYTFANGFLVNNGGNIPFDNRSIAGAQFLGSIRSSDGGPDVVHVYGELSNTAPPAGQPTDPVDYYAISLMAGQTIDVSVAEIGAVGDLHFGIYDPDQRQIATDYNVMEGFSIDAIDQTEGRTIRFTADRPGVYYIAVSWSGNTAFANTGTSGAFPYELKISQGIGDLAIGAVTAGTSIVLPGGATPTVTSANPSILADVGDVGAVVAGINGAASNNAVLGIVSTNTTVFGIQSFLSGYSLVGVASGDITVSSGDLRTLMGGSLGFQNTQAVLGLDFYGPDLNVNGSVGLIRSTAGVLAETFGNAARGNIQMVDSAASLLGVYRTNQALGVVRAASMEWGTAATEFHVNVDNLGNDGIIDLIDVTGNVGILVNGNTNTVGGGPAIITGQGGNVRFMHVGGILEQDVLFSSGQLGNRGEVVQPPGKVTFTDDSGATITLTPSTVVNGTTSTAGQLTTLSYGVRGTAGVVLLEVTSTTDLTVSASTGSAGRSAEVGMITVQGAGAPIVVNNGIPVVNATGGAATNSVVINSEDGGRVDVMMIQNSGGNTIDSIVNNSPGDIMNMNVGDVGTINTKGSLGTMASTTGTVINPIAQFSNAFPFVDQRFGLNVGNVASISAAGALGNIVASGVVGTITANSDGIDDPTLFEGVIGPIVVNGSAATTVTIPNSSVSQNVSLQTLNIGEGIAAGGTGAMYKSGLFAAGRILNVNGTDADIRGPIVSQNNIGSINLGGTGSIINTTLTVVSDFTMSQTYFQWGTTAYTFPNFTTIPSNPVFNISSVNINGNGGILGTLFLGASIGNITVGNGGYGIFQSAFETLPLGTVNSVVAGGYGIRSVLIRTGRVGTISATGSGAVSGIGNYPLSVRTSETPVLTDYKIDPFDGQQPSDLNDIDVYLQGDPTLHTPDPAGLTTGVIERVVATGQMTLGSVLAYNTLNSLFAFALSTGTVNIRNDAVTTQFQTGTLQSLTVNNNATDLDLEVAGKIGTVVIKGNFNFDPNLTTTTFTDLNAKINAKGPTGDIGSVTINGTFGAGTFIIGQSTVGTVTIGKAGLNGAASTGDFAGSLIVGGNHLTGTVLTTLKIFGDFADGFVNVTGDTGTIDIAHSFIASADHLVLNGNVGVLNVGSDPAQNNSVLSAPLIIGGNLGKGTITGSLTGSLLVKGDLTNLTIAAEPGTPAGTDLLTGSILATGLVTGLAIQGGVSGSVVGGQNVSVTLTNGSLENGASITSSLASITGVTVTNGNLNGNLNAPNGQITGVTVNGAGQGVGATSTIKGMSIGTITVPGNFGGTLISSTGITALKFGTLVGSGVINGGSLTSLATTGDLAGTVNIGNSLIAGTVTVGGNFTGIANFASPVSVSIAGGMAGGSMLTTSNVLNSLSVKGTLSGDVFADRTIGTLTAANITNAVITAGMGITTLTATGSINNSLIQVGAARGQDGLFGTGDLGEGPRMVNLTTLNFGTMTNSIVAAGGDITTVKSGGSMTGSSISTGLVLSGAAINGVLGDLSPLNDAGEMNTARQGATLYHGSFKSVTVGGKAGFGLNSGSAVTAGVSPGADGAFGTADDNVSSSVTGGASSFGSLKATNDGTSFVLTKTLSKAAGTTLVGYTLDNSASSIVPSDPVTGAPTAVASAGHPVTITGPGGTITITVTSKTGATVSVYDTDTTNNYIETLVINSTDGKASNITVVTSAPGAFDLGRVLATANTQVSSFVFNGDLVGDPLGGPALWIDSNMTTFSVRNLPNDATWSGQIGGNVGTLTVKQLGPGQLRVGGRITTLNVTSSVGNPLLQVLGTATPATAVTQLTSNPLDNSVLGSDGTNLLNIDPVTGTVGPSAPVQSPLGNGLLAVNGISFAPDGTLFGVATINNQLPVTTVGGLTPVGGTRLTGLAVNSLGQVFAVDLINGLDTLVQIDPTTGAETQIGVLRDVANDTFSQNVLSLAFDTNNNLLALVNDRDGSGVISSTANGVALAKIATSDPTHSGFVRISNPTSNGGNMAPVLITGNVQGAFTGMAVDSGGNIFAVRHVGGSDELDQLTITGNGAGATVTLANKGNIKVDGGATDTAVIGIGFDENDNLIGLNQNAGTEDLIGIITSAPGTSVRLSQPGVLTTTLNSFAIGKTGASFKSYGYSTGVTGNTFYANAGVVPTLGVITSSGPNMGTFTQLLPLVQDNAGTPLAGNALSAAVDASNHIFVITDTGQLAEYSTTTGALVGGQPLGAVVDSVEGNLLSITRIAFDGTGRLIGLNAQENRLVLINTTSTVLNGGNVVLASGLTEIGSVNASDLTSFTFDAASQKFVAYSSGLGAFANILGTTPASLGGLTAQSIGTANIGNGFTGRIAATGNGTANGIDNVKFTGSFSGTVTSDGSIGSVTGTGVTMNGSIVSHGNVGSVNMNGTIGNNGIISAADRLTNFSLTGTLSGTILAGSATTLTVNGSATGNALIAVHNDTGNLTVSGNEDGTISLGTVSNLKIGLQLGANGFVFLSGQAGTITLSGGTALNSLLLANQGVNSMTLGGTVLGVVGVRRSVGTLNVAAMNGGVVDVGGDITTLTVTGAMTDSLIGAGTWIGLDGVYNSDDDVIFGGSINTAKINGIFTDSLITAGVLPREGVIAGANGIPADSRAYTGNPAATLLANVNSAEVGGISRSVINTINFAKPVVSSNTVAGVFSAVVAADGINKATANNALQKAVLSDPVGTPTPVPDPTTGQLGVRFLPNEVRIVFNEPLDTATITPQSVVVRDGQGNLITNVTLAYTTQKAGDGTTQGVLRIISDNAFNNGATVNVTLSSAITDITGSRGALFDFNQDGTPDITGDPFGTPIVGQTITVGPPDFFDAPQILSGQPVTVTATNVGATKEVGEPNHAGNNGGASIWFNWTAPSSGLVTISTAGSNFDTLLAVYTGNTVGSLVNVASNDDFGGSAQSQVQFNAVQGVTYRIAVDGFNFNDGNGPETGTVQLSIV